MQAALSKGIRSARHRSPHLLALIGVVAFLAVIAIGLATRGDEVSPSTAIIATNQEAAVAVRAGQAEAYATQLDGLRQQGQVSAHMSEVAAVANTEANQYASQLDQLRALGRPASRASQPATAYITQLDSLRQTGQAAATSARQGIHRAEDYITHLDALRQQAQAPRSMTATDHAGYLDQLRQLGSQ